MFIMGMDPTKVYDHEAWIPGTRGLDHLGREFVFVQFDETSATLAVGNACLIHADHTAIRATATLAASGTGGGKQVGLAMAAAADNQYCWLARYGHGFTASAATDALAYTRLAVTATEGVVDDAAAGETVNIVGMALEVAETDDNLTVATLNYPIIGTDLDTQ